MIKKIRNNIQNIPGKRLPGKLIVFESDDWGSLRIPSRKIMEQLEQNGIDLQSNPFNYLDALETDDDLDSLFHLLAGFKDSRGNHPVITANAVVANPDFENIRKNNFEAYSWEGVKETYAKDPLSRNAFQTFSDGMQAGLIWPQLHGREHLNTDQWLSALRNGDQQMLKAFELGVFAIDYKNTHSLRNNFMAAFDFNDAQGSESKEEIIEQGVLEFKKIYSVQPKSFIAPCYVWHPNLDGVLHKHGIKYIQGINYQFAPDIGKPQYKKIVHTQGETNQNGQRYLVRNAFFEPSLNGNIDWVENCMQRIKIAFFWGKPAIIGTHRINFMGRISESNRVKTHVLLKKLLEKITQTWDDVEFTTTDRLGDLY